MKEKNIELNNNPEALKTVKMWRKSKVKIKGNKKWYKKWF